MSIISTVHLLSQRLMRDLQAEQYNEELNRWLEVIGSMREYKMLPNWEVRVQDFQFSDNVDVEKKQKYKLAEEIFEFGRYNMYAALQVKETVKEYERITKLLHEAGVKDIPEKDEVDVSRWQVLAFRIYPEPRGTVYNEQDLLSEEAVIVLFDYCQILEAIIYQEGWTFLMKHYGIEKLYQLNNQSGWFDVQNLEAYKSEIQLYLRDLYKDGQELETIITFHESSYSKDTYLILPDVSSDYSEIDALKQATHLNDLRVCGSNVDNNGLEKIYQLQQLETLQLYSTTITNAGLKRINSLTNLRELYLIDNPQITDQGMMHLSQLLQLELIKFYEVSITLRGLEYLLPCTKLSSIILDASILGTAAKNTLREKELLQFSKLLPNCEVVIENHMLVKNGIRYY